MAGLRVRLDKGTLARAIDAVRKFVPSRKDALLAGMRRVGESAVKEIVTRYRSGPGSADATRRRTGRLAASYAYDLAETQAGATLGVGIVAGARALVYAGVHEGMDSAGRSRASTTIRPRRGKYLAIPLEAATTPAGVPRRRSPRDYDDLFRIGDALFQRRGKRIVPMYALVRQVTIRARPAIRKVQPNVVKGIEEAFRDAYGRA
jgi:hypothetical protein